MKVNKVLVFLVLLAIAAVLYSVFSDPVRREKVLSTIEGSTGVELNGKPEKILEDAGKAVGSGAEKLFKDLGDTLSDPRIYRSIERWGRDALNNLDETQLNRLKRDLEREAKSADKNFDKVFEKYLGKSEDS